MSRGLDLWQWDGDGVAATGERSAAALGRRAGRLHDGLDERVPFAAVGAAAEELGALVAALLTDELGVGLGHLKPRTRNFRALLWGISPQRTRRSRRRNGGGTEGNENEHRGMEGTEDHGGRAPRDQFFGMGEKTGVGCREGGVHTPGSLVPWGEGEPRRTGRAPSP